MFGSKKQIVVAATTLNLCENPPNATKDAILRAIANKDLSIADSLLDASLSGFASKIGSLYSYADNYYTLGLPQGFYSGLSQPDERQVQPVIESIVGEPVSIRYCFFDGLTLEYIVLDYLNRTKTYDSVTNQVPSTYFHTNGGITIVYDIEYIHPQQIKITYQHNYNSTLYYEAETIAIPSGMYIGQKYYIAGYSINSDLTNKVHTWLHNAFSTTYPELTYDIFTPFNKKHYLPIVPIRRNNVDLTANKSTELYRTSKALLNRVKVDIDTIADKINENPDVKEIDHAYIMFGVPIQTKNQACLKYLIEYFDFLGSVSNYSSLTHKTNTARGLLPNENRSTIDLTLMEYGLKLDLDFVSIHTSYYKGSVTKVGKLTSQLLSGGRVRYIANFTETKYTEHDTQVILREQINSNFYKEVVVTGLKHINYIYEQHTVETSIGDAISQQENETNFIIPIYYEISADLPMTIQNELYGDSFRIVLNSYKEVKLKWYQTGFFKILAFAIGIVISIVTGGFGAFVNSLMSAIANGFIAFLEFLIPRVLISIASKFAFKYIGEKLGVEVTAILGLVMMGSSMLPKFSGSNINVLGHTFPTSSALLTIGNSLVGGAQTVIQGEISKIQQQSMALDAEIEEKTDLLEKANELLETDSAFDPLNFTGLQTDLSINSINLISESPNMFYNRTIHAGNVGVLTLDVIENYCDSMLKLPSSIV